MSKKKKDKKINAKKEKYIKFRKEKPSNMTLSSVDLTPEQEKQRKADEDHIDSFSRYNRSPPNREILERKTKSKR
jgi:hypothetical protein